jgi:hypothetical protein
MAATDHASEPHETACTQRGVHRWKTDAIPQRVSLRHLNVIRSNAQRGKKDAADAEAICEAVTQPVRLVGI